MPSSKTTYFCNICGKEYQKEDIAEKCENEHKVPKDIASYEYDRSDNKCKYPESVLISFGDKKTPDNIRYYRHPDGRRR